MCYVDTSPSLIEDDEMDMDLNFALSLGVLKNVLHYRVIISYNRVAPFYKLEVITLKMYQIKLNDLLQLELSTS